jgi:MYXO-CTERM domain-containing protein
MKRPAEVTSCARGSTATPGESVLRARSFLPSPDGVCVRLSSRLLVALSVCAAASAVPSPSDAIVIARVTRRGYILTDTPAYPASVLAAQQDGGVSDAAVDGGADGGLPPGLARDALLGRGNITSTGVVTNRSHWNYFFHSGGSPMEGNNWEETSPGNFRTGRPTFRFSDFDLYFMGLIPRAEVNPGFLIVDPQNVPRGISRNSAPEFYNRTVSVRGRRVDVTIDDVIRQNGPRNPAYPAAPRELDVVWILWAPVGAVDNALADEFDEAIDSCALGYSTSTGNRGRLNAVVAPPTPVEDAGTLEDASRPDIVLPDDVTRPGTDEDAAVTDAPTSEVPLSVDAGTTAPPAQGCGCAVPVSRSSHGALALAALAALLGRRRRSRAA